MFCKMKSFKIPFAILSVAILVAIMCIGAHTVPNIASAEDATMSPAVTEKIYWGIADTKLIISSEEIDGVSESGTVDSNGNIEQSEDNKKIIGWEGLANSITSVEVQGHVTPTSTYGWFYNLTNCTDIDLEGLDTSQVTNMSFMFGYCFSLTSLNISGFDTSKVTDMSDMFVGCNLLTSLDISSFNTSQVTNMAAMFKSCSKLTALDLSSFDTSQVTDMRGMFGDDACLTLLNLSGFDTLKVSDMSDMFSECASLSSLDLSSFKIKDGANTGDMFDSCKKLDTLVCPSEISTDFELPNKFWDGNGDVVVATSAQAGKTLRKHSSHKLVPIARKDATCTEYGYIQHIECEVCNKFFIEDIETPEQDLIIPSLGHDYSAEFTTDVAPTCTTAGSASKHCSRCDSKSEVTEIAALGHDFGEWLVYKEATKKEDGEERRVCSHDSTHYETRVIPKLKASANDSPVLLALVIILAIIVAGEIGYLTFRAVKKHSQSEEKV